MEGASYAPAKEAPGRVDGQGVVVLGLEAGAEHGLILNRGQTGNGEWFGFDGSETGGDACRVVVEPVLPFGLHMWREPPCTGIDSPGNAGAEAATEPRRGPRLGCAHREIWPRAR